MSAFERTLKYLIVSNGQKLLFQQMCCVGCNAGLKYLAPFPHCSVNHSLIKTALLANKTQRYNMYIVKGKILKDMQR